MNLLRSTLKTLIDTIERLFRLILCQIKKKDKTMKPKVLFISNKRSLPYTDDCKDQNEKKYIDSGLSNSIRFIVEMLEEEGYEAKYEQVIDGNGIDREVHKYKPNIVVLEAIWVTPKKLQELANLHKKVKWNVRVHSEMPFIANEGNAIEWLFRYLDIPNVTVSANSDRMYNDLKIVMQDRIEYLPNFYSPKQNIGKKKKKEDKDIDIGCFGAIRPMKNQLSQAIAAIKFAEYHELKLNFHVNINREEQGGNSVLKNLRSLFNNCSTHELIEHPWMKHQDFEKLVRKMDIGMQVSFSETFNIVTADMVNNLIPVVVSPEIRWLPKNVQAHPTNIQDMFLKLSKVHVSTFEDLCENVRHLQEYNEQSIKEWKHFLKKFGK